MRRHNFDLTVDANGKTAVFGVVVHDHNVSGDADATV